MYRTNRERVGLRTFSKGTSYNILTQSICNLSENILRTRGTKALYFDVFEKGFKARPGLVPRVSGLASCEKSGRFLKSISGRRY